MPVECTGRQVAITQPLRTLAEEGIERIARILGKITSAHVVLTAEKYRQIAEVRSRPAPARWWRSASPAPAWRPRCATRW